MSAFLFRVLRKQLEYRRNQKMTRSQLEELQLQKFRRLVRYAKQHSPYYARIIDDRGIEVHACTPSDFPLLTKSTLMANYDDVVTDHRISKRAISDFLSHSTDPNELLFDQYQVIHTSGSSGQVGYFVFSQSDWANGLAQGFRQRMVRLRPRRSKAAFFGATGGHFAGVSMASMAKRGIFRWLMDVGIYEVNTPLAEVVEHLNAFQPDMLGGYPTALKMLAEKQMEGSLRISPTRMGTSGETLPDSDRRLLAKVFGCGVGNGYGCSEHLLMGYSAADDATMILFDDDFICEFHEDCTVVTNLFNFTLPLIRYHMSDILRPIEGDDSASPYMIVNNVVGRTEIVPKFVNEDGAQDFINPLTIVELFVPGVMRFQMHLLGSTHFQFRVCLDTSLTPEQKNESLVATEKRLKEILAQKRMSNVTFDVVAVDDLPLNPKTRKFQLIVGG